MLFNLICISLEYDQKDIKIQHYCFYMKNDVFESPFYVSEVLFKTFSC